MPVPAPMRTLSPFQTSTAPGAPAAHGTHALCSTCWKVRHSAAPPPPGRPPAAEPAAEAAAPPAPDPLSMSALDHADPATDKGLAVDAVRCEVSDVRSTLMRRELMRLTGREVPVWSEGCAAMRALLRSV